MQIIPQRIGTKIPLAMALFGCIVALAIAAQLPPQIETFVRKAAIAESQTNVDQIKSLRAYYTRNVVAPVLATGGVNAHYQHDGDDTRIPLPATMVHELSERFSKSGRELRLFSTAPFPNRVGRTLDAFELNAWEHFEKTDAPVYWRTEIVADREILWVAVADTMTEMACVECHNTHPESPKRDWKLGDVRGVLELQVDLTENLEAARHFSWLLASVLIAVAFAGSLGLFVYMRRILLSPMNQISSAAMAYAGGDFSASLTGTDRGDEIGILASSLKRFREQSVEVAAARAAQDNERRLQEILESSPAGISITRHNSGERLYTNGRFNEMLTGDPTVSVVDMKIEESFADTKELESIQRTLVANGYSHDAESLRKRTDGTTLWCLQSWRPIKLWGGDAFICWHFDISERRAAEEIVKQSEARINSILENSPMGIAIVSNDSGRRLYSNPRFNEMITGDKEASTLDLDVSKSFENAAVLENLRNEIIAHEFDYAAEIERIRTDGSRFWCLHDWKPIGGWGEGAYICWHVDITERKTSERELDDQRAVLQIILESVNQSVVLYDADKRLSMWNHHYPETLELPAEELTRGRPLADLIRLLASRGIYGEEDIESAIETRITSLWNGMRGTDISFGGDRHFDVQSVLTEDGGLVITFTDISERKKTERIITNALALINESIQYASRIQRSVLPTPEQMASALGETMVIWEPKDVVGGDIYLLRPGPAGVLLMVADCTGHGVPGAFVTMVATGALEQALIEISAADPAALLSRVNRLMKDVLGQDTAIGESDDGLECGLCVVDREAKTITYAGARFELWSVKDDEMTIVKGDRAGLGYRRTRADQTFTNHTIPMHPNTTYYLGTDGLTDQIGGPKRRGYGKRRLKESLLSVARMKLAAQSAHILRAFEEYQHREERRDDITLIGFRPDI